MEEFIQNYCTCTTDNKAQHILETHVTDILTDTLRPIFKKQVSSHPTLTNKLKPKYGSFADNDLHENQEWKTSNYVEILIWIVQEISTKDLEQNLHLIIPPVLIVLDDYDISYKEQGVHMVHQLIKKLENISSLGLDNVFFESLFHCLSYVSEDRDIPLLKAAYPCILDLIASKKDSKARTTQYEKVLKGGVMTGFMYAIDKINFIPVLLAPLPILHQELGIISVQYLKETIPVVCRAMSKVSTTNTAIRDINLNAAKALIAMIKACWPRIPSYRGIIMKSIAKSWMHYYNTKDKEMCDLIKQAYLVFDAACQGQDKADKDALISFNPTVFNQLFT